jgi:hypothetical protein
MRVAYALFSPRYRSEVSFETFEETVRAHGAIFRATSVRKESEIETVARAEIKLRLETRRRSIRRALHADRNRRPLVDR